MDRGAWRATVHGVTKLDTTERQTAQLCEHKSAPRAPGHSGRTGQLQSLHKVRRTPPTALQLMQLFRALETQQQQPQAHDLGQREFSHNMTNTCWTLTLQARKRRKDNCDTSDFLRKQQLNTQIPVCSIWPSLRPRLHVNPSSSHSAHMVMSLAGGTSPPRRSQEGRRFGLNFARHRILPTRSRRGNAATGWQIRDRNPTHTLPTPRQLPCAHSKHLLDISRRVYFLCFSLQPYWNQAFWRNCVSVALLSHTGLKTGEHVTH